MVIKIPAPMGRPEFVPDDCSWAVPEDCGFRSEEEVDEEEEVQLGWLHSGLPWWTLTRKRKRGHFPEGLLKVTGQSGLRPCVR